MLVVNGPIGTPLAVHLYEAVPGMDGDSYHFPVLWKHGDQVRSGHSVSVYVTDEDPGPLQVLLVPLCVVAHSTQFPVATGKPRAPGPAGNVRWATVPVVRRYLERPRLEGPSFGLCPRFSVGDLSLLLILHVDRLIYGVIPVICGGFLRHNEF